MNKKRTGIGQSLTLIFVILATLPLVAALIGGLSQRAARAPIDEVQTTGERFFSDYRHVIAAASELKRELDTVGTSEGDWSAEDFGREADVHLETLRAIAGSIDYPFLDDEFKGELQASVARIGARADAIIRSARKLTQRAERMKEHVEAIRYSVDLLDKQTREQGAASEADISRPEFAERLGELRFWVATLSRTAAEAASTTDKRVVERMEVRFAASLRSATFQLSTLPDGAEKTLFAEGLEELFEQGRGQDNLFHLVYQQLDDRRVTQLSKMALDASIHSLLKMTDQMAASYSARTSTSLASAENALNTSWAALLTSGIVSALIALLVSKRYVFDRIIRRLRQLSNTTVRLSNGDLDIDIESDGNDEITDLQNALSVFRRNANELKEHDQKLALRTTELELACQELDNFAYAASHDLKAPLRSIDSLATFVIEDVGDQLPDESAEHLQMIRQRIVRLETLLGKMLEYSRVGRKELIMDDVDLDELVRRSAELVMPQNFRLKLGGDFPTVHTAIAPIEQVVRNLVDNAVKHHDRESGEIVVSGQMADGEFELTVADDGPGIEPQYHERIFGLFQTLKTRDEVEGSGMGLALLRKAVEALGGSISVASDPSSQRGATFSVRWPVGRVAKTA